MSVLGYDFQMYKILQRKSILVFACLALLMALALILRLIGIGKESLWWDEYASHVYLNAPTLFDFLMVNRTLDPMSLPFYFTLEYLWTHYVYDSVLSLRLLSIAIGIATIPPLYALGKRMFGTWAGLTAAALLAVSPTHIHHSQSIRMYVVFIFLSAVVAWTFVRLLEKPRLSLWVLHGSASLLLYWTHPFAGLIPAVLGGYLLLRLSSHVPFFVRWTLLQCLLFAPTVIYLSRARFWPLDSTSKWLERPSLSTLFTDILLDDVPAFQWQLKLSDFAVHLGVFRLGIDLLFSGLVLSLLLWLAVRMLRGEAAVLAPERRNSLLLFIWLLLPPLLLFTVSWTVRPCMFPRYTAHCTLALFLLLGGAVLQVRAWHWRILLSAALTSVLVLQWAWLQPGPQRTDWHSAGLLLHEQAKENDVVLVENPLWRGVFTHNLKYMTPGPLPIPVAAAETAPLLAAQAALCLGMLPRHHVSGPPPRVWAVIALDYFEPGPSLPFEQSLRAWDLSFETWSFPSIREVVVYHITPSVTPPPDSMEALFARWDKAMSESGAEGATLDHHGMRAFGDLALELALRGQSKPALEILTGIFIENGYAEEIYGSIYHAIESGENITAKAAAVNRLLDGYMFRTNDQIESMRRAFAEAASLDPGHALANYEHGLELSALGDYQNARRAFLSVLQNDPSYGNKLANLLEALNTNEGINQKLEALLAYQNSLIELSRSHAAEAELLLHQALTHDPHFSEAHLILGYILASRGDFDGAKEAVKQYVHESHAPDWSTYLEIVLIAAEHNARTIVMEMLDVYHRNNPAAHLVYDSFIKAANTNGDIENAAASLRALHEGIEMLRHDRQKAASDAFARSVELDPLNTFARLELWLQQAAQNDRPVAIEALKFAIKQHSEYQHVLQYLLHDLENNTDLKNSLPAAQSYLHGVWAQSHGKKAEATEAFEKAKQLDTRLNIIPWDADSDHDFFYQQDKSLPEENKD